MEQPEHPTPAQIEHSSVNVILFPTPQRRRVLEADMAQAIADWFEGEPWSLADAVWAGRDRKSVHLQDIGDRLVCQGHTIATRRPPAVALAEPGTNLAHFAEARAVARIALRGDHQRLYRLPR